jgi:hypothetical protein
LYREVKHFDPDFLPEHGSTNHMASIPLLSDFFGQVPVPEDRSSMDFSVNGASAGEGGSFSHGPTYYAHRLESEPPWFKPPRISRSTFVLTVHFSVEIDLSGKAA